LYATVRPGSYPILGSTFYHRRRHSSACISANIRRFCLSTFASRSTTSVTSSLQTFQAFSAALRLLFRSFTHRFLQAHHHPRRIIRSRLVDHENPSSLPTTLVLIPSRDSHARQDISTITALLHYRHPAPVRTALPAHLSTAEHHPLQHRLAATSCHTTTCLICSRIRVASALQYNKPDNPATSQFILDITRHSACSLTSPSSPFVCHSPAFASDHCLVFWTTSAQ